MAAWDLEALADRFCTSLSGGELPMTLIARALVKNRLSLLWTNRNQIWI
jgi:ABC-type cobalamin/Fe3+-siderophores transport system ATPase subunit